MEERFRPSTWFVTGATGLVGSAVVEELRDNDVFVIALVRENSPDHMIQFLLDKDVKLVYGDLLDPTTYRDYLPTADVVVHSAAAVQIKDPKTNWRLNYEGTKKLATAMVQQSVNRMIFISTAGVYGKAYVKKVSEEVNPEPYGPYLTSKYQAERELLNTFKSLSTTVIRPPFIFGDPNHDRHLYPTLVDGLPTNFLPKVWRNDPQIGFVHAEDVARLVFLTGSKQQTPSHVYNVQSFNIRLSDLYRMLGEARGRQPKIIPIPYTIFWIISVIGDFVMRIRGKPFGIRQRLAIARKNWIFSQKRARKELGFESWHRDETELERLMSEYNRINNQEDSDPRNFKEIVDSIRNA